MILSASPIYATLDLGSNSFHLLIATFSGDKLVVIDDIKAIVQLAAGLQADKTLPQSCIEKALDALYVFADRLQSIDRRHLRVIGTSTLRQAKNADVFLLQAEKILNANIDIISGVEEARLIFLGVSKDYSPTMKRLIIDIGGGSTECVVGQWEAEQLNSLHVGCVQFSKQYFDDGKITAKRYQQAFLAARVEAQTIAHAMTQTQWQEAIGASGTIRCIHQIIIGTQKQSLITLASLEKLAAEMIQIGCVEKLNYSALNDNRRNILPGGVAILHALFVELSITQMETTEQAIREGIIYEMDGRTSYLGRREKTISQLQQQYHVDELQAQNVSATAILILQKLNPVLAEQTEMCNLLLWAAQLHEIGLLINHSGYHKHSGYIIENSSMPGFSQQMQQSIAYLVTNHRRKIRQSIPHYGVTQNKHLLIALRLAWLFCRRRGVLSLPPMLTIKHAQNVIKLSIDAQWLKQFPLVHADLQQEQKHLQTIDITLEINTKKVI